MGTGREIELSFSSHLSTPPEAVWAVVSTMEGVNAELRPWLRMTYPAESGHLAEVDVTPGEPLFDSWLLLGGVVPIDRHRLALERLLPGEGFDEESTSSSQRRWRHERRVVSEPDGGCHVTDRLVVVPRIGVMRPVVARAVEFLFDHRHRRLRQRFGPTG